MKGKRTRHFAGILRQKWKSKKGMTMVEILVTFALIGMFLTGTCRVMSDSLTIYYKMKALNHAKQTMDTLMDKVTGEIEGAQVNMKDNGGARNGGEVATLTISGDRKKITLYDRTSSSIYITREGSRLMIYYNKVESGEWTRYEAVKWKYDEAAYMGFELADLTFSLAGSDYPRNVVKVFMKLTSPKYGSYETTRYVECYNFHSDQDFLKIVEEPEIPASE